MELFNNEMVSESAAVSLVRSITAMLVFLQARIPCSSCGRCFQSIYSCLIFIGPRFRVFDLAQLGVLLTKTSSTAAYLFHSYSQSSARYRVDFLLSDISARGFEGMPTQL